MLTIAMAIALLALVVVGSWYVSTTRLAGGTERRSAFVLGDARVLSTVDRRNPGRILGDRAKLRNAAVVVAEGVAIAVAVGVCVAAIANPAVGMAYKVVLSAGLVVGTALVGQAMYVRLGFYHPDLVDPADYRQSLALTADERTGEAFLDLKAAADTARGEELDDATLGVVAAARGNVALETIAQWGEASGVADASRVHDRAQRLAAADLVRIEDGCLEVGAPLEGADDDQVASAAASVLS
jgi:hypothetical protein